MNWLTNTILPKIRNIVGVKDVPDNLWQKCPGCEGMLFSKDLTDNMNVCTHCGYHMKFPVQERLQSMFDNGSYTRIKVPEVAADPLKFRDKKKYADRLKEAQTKTGERDGIMVGEGTMGGIPVVIAAFNFDFMGGSMGAGVGEGLVRAAEAAIAKRAALIAIPASGGARMQEGMLSLIQMPRTTIAVQMVKDAGLPYFVLLTDPTTGGVSASFAMLGDIHISEPGAMIGFAGKRVIEETIREQLPPGFQTAEYLKEHGMVDMVTPRQELRDTFIRLLDILMRKDRNANTVGTGAATKTGLQPSGRGVFTADSFSAGKTKMKAPANQEVAEQDQAPATVAK